MVYGPILPEHSRGDDSGAVEQGMADAENNMVVETDSRGASPVIEDKSWIRRASEAIRRKSSIPDGALEVMNHRSIFAGMDEDQSTPGEVRHSFYEPPQDPLMVGRQPQRDTTQKKARTMVQNAARKLVKCAKLFGPGVLVSASFVDPGNFTSDLAAGSSYQFKLLFILLLATMTSIFMQCLSTKLGAVTGLNLAQMIKLHFPWWLNIILYIVAEISIMATDVAEIIGAAIALNLLFNIPLVAGCAISILDVLVVLYFYRPSGKLSHLRLFELFIFTMLLGLFACFCYQLTLLENVSAGEVFLGYVPSKSLVESVAIYQSCAMLGSMIDPSCLYLGSGMCLPRMLQYDQRQNKVAPSTTLSPTAPNSKRRSRHQGKTSTLSSSTTVATTATALSTSPLLPCLMSRQIPTHYAPSLSAIRYCLRTSIIEITLYLTFFALFVNSAIIIVAGGALRSMDAANATLFQIHDLLAAQLGRSAGIIFAVSLLLSGSASGIVTTVAGQMVSEGQVSWQVRPWMRRLITRSVAMIPAMIIAAVVGKTGLYRALEYSQVVLCFCLPSVMGSLVWFTAHAVYCGVKVAPNGERVLDTADDEEEPRQPDMPAHAPAGIVLRVDGLSDGSGMLTDVTATATEVKQVTSIVQGKVADATRPALKVEGDIAPWTSDERSEVRTVQFRNHWATTSIAVLIWIVILTVNMATIVFLAMGKTMVPDPVASLAQPSVVPTFSTFPATLS